MDTLRSEAKPQLKNFPKVKADDRHNIQTHVAYLDLLVKKKKICFLYHSTIFWPFRLKYIGWSVLTNHGRWNKGNSFSHVFDLKVKNLLIKIKPTVGLDANWITMYWGWEIWLDDIARFCHV